MKERLLAWSGGLIITVAIVGFLVFIAVAGLNKASELAGVIGALVAVAGLALTVAGLVASRRSEVAKPVIKETLGPPPWTIHNDDIRLTVIKVARGTTKELNETRATIQITADVTRMRPSRSHLEYRFSSADNGRVLEEDNFGSDDGDDLPVNQCTRINKVLFDVSPPANALTVTLHDFFWPEGRDLILREVPISST
ncbi:MAG TPA: hypothetical protein VFE59_31295 [Trebonia sp.]|jgi:hypothetical protein|nr:hypothetical protein [Trebonia sp.]